MRHCQNCNRGYSDKYFRKHCHTNKHIYTKKENILVIDSVFFLYK